MVESKFGGAPRTSVFADAYPSLFDPSLRTRTGNAMALAAPVRGYTPLAPYACWFNFDRSPRTDIWSATMKTSTALP